MHVLCEKDLARQLETVATPVLRRYEKTGKLENGIYYETYFQPASRGTVVISHGFTEASIKYHEFIYYLLTAGYSCAVLDHRGHGHSPRPGRHPNVVHISRFEEYVEDLHRFMEAVVLPQAPKPLLLYGHSMGGCVAAQYLEDHPEVFARAVLNAPMLGLQTGGIPGWAGVLLCRLKILLGQGDQRVFFHKDFDPAPVFEEDCATSRARFDHYQALRRGDPDLQTSAASYSWTKEALQAGKKALRRADRVTVPVLLFQAETDTLVDPEAQAEFIRRIPNGRLVRVPGSKHEIYRSEDPILETYWDQLLAFLAG